MTVDNRAPWDIFRERKYAKERVPEHRLELTYDRWVSTC